MQPTEVLHSEHRVIEQVLACLEKIVDRGLAEGKLDGTAADQALDFFRGFADRCHHGKEEQHLFPLLEARGLPREGGPTGVMLYEHDQGRQHMQAMADSLEGAAAGQRPALGKFAEHARAYIQLLRQHIFKEDHVLFAMADQVLNKADQERLLDRFEHMEHEDMKHGTHERYLRLADALAERFGVAKAQGKALVCAACGHGQH